MLPLLFIIRPVSSHDVSFLWDMLFYAAHMAEDGATSSAAARQNPFLAQYVEGWGRSGDLGFVAIEANSNAQQRLGAAWVRLLIDNKQSASYVDERTPELAIAVLPSLIGQGIGTALVKHLIAVARVQYPAIVLSVRAGNPAVQLYQRLGFRVIDEIINRVGTKSYKMLIKF
jgi:ribosomal protein S18 acetylase RimI-like enzyme